jgi:phospholipase/lecithinase/hemolysin
LMSASAVREVLGIRNLDSKATVPPGVLTKEQVPALVVFGDSTVDAGNNNYMDTIVKSNFLPYGMNFAGHVPTGRFTDGLLATDFVSQKLGIPLQLPYMSPDAHGEAILTGVNIASSASGWFDSTAKHFNVMGLDTQLEYYNNWKKEVVKVAGPERGNFIISNALYAISTGTNDWVNNYFVNLHLQSLYSTDKYTTILVGNIRKYTMELYSMGGRNILLMGLPPLGCVPAQITLHGHGNSTCVQSLNDVASKMNQQIISLLEGMKKDTPGARLIYIDIFAPIYNAFQDPQKYGFKYARDGCCGTGDLEVSVLCNRITATTCSNPSEHIFWDSFHPTSHFYSQLADYMYKLAGPIILAPPNP